jgi:hypothetical protein
MKISIDRIRKSLARAFNNVVADYYCSNDRDVVQEHLNDLRNVVAAILYIYDEETIEKENDFHELGNVADKLFDVFQDKCDYGYDESDYGAK